MVLNGLYHYWKYVFVFARGLSQMEAWLLKPPVSGMGFQKASASLASAFGLLGFGQQPFRPSLKPKVPFATLNVLFCSAAFLCFPISLSFKATLASRYPLLNV